MNTDGGNMDSYVKKRKRSLDGDGGGKSPPNQGLSRSEPSTSISNSGGSIRRTSEGLRSPLSPPAATDDGGTAAKKRKQEDGEKEASIQPPTNKGGRDSPVVDIQSFFDPTNVDHQKKLREFQVKSLAIEPKEIKIGRRLGGGQNGVVHEGECRSKKVAIKVCKNIVGKKWDDFLEEIQIMATHTHPNVALLMGASISAGEDLKIVMELLDGDVDNLLIKSKEGHLISLFTRLCMAKDAALGLNWLHNSEPAIIHSDLKLENLMYKKTHGTYLVKVADFGFSAMKRKSEQFLLVSSSFKGGTPHTVAPEILRRQGFNQKADVYSFAMVLWGIYTCLPLYPHHSDFRKFRQAILEGERPEIPNNCPHQIRRLLEDCWQEDPNQRPDFDEINERLDEILIIASISDPAGQEFWKTYFMKEHTVSWTAFADAFYQYLKLPLPSEKKSDGTGGSTQAQPMVQAATATTTTASGNGNVNHVNMNTKTEEKSEKEEEEEDDRRGRASPENDRELGNYVIEIDEDEEMLKYKCLKALVANGERVGKDEVHIQKFGDFLSWFGSMLAEGSDVPLDRYIPLSSNKRTTILDCVRDRLSHQWFHGDISREEAQRRLNGKPVGTYLVRFNSSIPGAYTLDRIVAEQSIESIRIIRNKAAGGYMFESAEGPASFPSLLALIGEYAELLGLLIPCPGSRFQSLFKNQPTSIGYPVFL